MKEIKRILEVYEQIDLSVRKVALATVIYVAGSAYATVYQSSWNTDLCEGARFVLTEQPTADLPNWLRSDMELVMHAGKPVNQTYENQLFILLFFVIPTSG